MKYIKVDPVIVKAHALYNRWLKTLDGKRETIIGDKISYFIRKVESDIEKRKKS